MENEINTTQDTALEVTRNEVTHNNNEVQAGTHPVKSEVIKTYSEDEVNSQMKKTRMATEKEVKKNILAQLGLTLDDEDKLQAFKEAYQNSLSDEEKKTQVMEELQADNIVLNQTLEEKEYIIQALIELTGKNESDVEKIVKMARGLKTEENTIQDAIKEVISMVNMNQPSHVMQVNNNIPIGQALQQPSTTIQVNTQDNPFKPETFNLGKQMELYRTDIELYKKLKSEAGK